MQTSTKLANTRIPSIGGSSVIGQLATATSGSWTPSGVATSFQWFRESSSGATAISGATGTSYRNTAADAGYRLRVRVIGSRAGYISRSAWTTSSAPIHR